MIRLFTFVTMFGVLSLISGTIRIITGMDFFEMSALILCTRLGLTALLIHTFKSDLVKAKLW